MKLEDVLKGVGEFFIEFGVIFFAYIIYMVSTTPEQPDMHAVFQVLSMCTQSIIIGLLLIILAELKRR